LEKVAIDGMHVLMHELPFEDFLRVTQNIENSKHLSWFSEYKNLRNVVTIEVPSDLHEVAIKALDDAVLLSLGNLNVAPLKLAGSTTFNTHNASIVAASCICGPGAQTEGVYVCVPLLSLLISKCVHVRRFDKKYRSIFMRVNSQTTTG
jgi:hypothetical protein